ncbi:DUF7507 domain-containing protein [Nocardioides sp. MAHUQ-72]|uniref:DUF7507 domain-containing protein n=1 Tax=unclassified Nocardioides TaxID=2615069 RepID=UPI003610DCB2
MRHRLAALVAVTAMTAAAALVPSAAFAGNGNDPAGNNGTIKIAELADEGTPGNDPHLTGCSLTVEWYGFDQGSKIISQVDFEMQAPTKDVGLTVQGDTSVFVGGDAAGGGTDLDGRKTYVLAFKGQPQAQQGYHVKLTVETGGSQGNNSKSKVFWVQGCEAPAPALKLTKSVTDSADEDSLAAEGETLTYGFSVTNTGNVPLTDVKVTDPMIPALASGATCVATLPVGATTTCPALPAATHTVTAAEVRAGSVVNTATAAAKSSGGSSVAATGSARATIATKAAPAAAPALRLTKSVTDSADEDSLAAEGETLTYGFSVTNTGNVPLTDVKVTDPMIPALASGATCVATLPVGATTTCPALPAATHTVTAAEAATGTIVNTATATGTPAAGTAASSTASASIDTYAPATDPTDPTGPTGPSDPGDFSWDWEYDDPSCTGLTVDYPANIPDGQANDVNVRVQTDKGQVTLNFHNNDGFWGGTASFPYASHRDWPAGVTSYSVVWTQVGGTNYHWQGTVRCLVTDDGDPATTDLPVGVTTIAGWRTSTVTVDKGNVVTSDAVSVQQADEEPLTLQRLTNGVWTDVRTVRSDEEGAARVTFGRQSRKGTFRYRLAVDGTDAVTGATTRAFTVRVR